MLVADGSLAVGQRLPAVRDLANRRNLATTPLPGRTRDWSTKALCSPALAAARWLPIARWPAGELDAASRERMQRVVRQLVAYTLALGHSPAQVVHAVRAELAAFGRADAAQSVPTVQIRPELPSLRDSRRRPTRERTRRAQRQRRPRSTLAPCSYSVPLALAETSSALLAETLDGQPLALDHGAPWRLVLPGGCLLHEREVDRSTGELVADHAGDGPSVTSLALT